MKITTLNEYYTMMAGSEEAYDPEDPAVESLAIDRATELYLEYDACYELAEVGRWGDLNPTLLIDCTREEAMEFYASRLAELKKD